MSEALAFDVPDLEWERADRHASDAAVYRHDKTWCESNLKITVKKGGQPLDLEYNAAQVELERLFQEQTALGRAIRWIILKARQLGVSTWMESVVYDWTKHSPYQNALILAHDSDGSSRLFGMFDTYYTHDKTPLQTRYSHQKGLTYAAPHSSEILVQTAGKKFAGTSLTIQIAHLSEVAKWPDPETTVLSLMQAVPDLPGTMAVMESTAAGSGDWFHSQWKNAIAGVVEEDDEAWTPIFFPWFFNPEYSRPVPEGGLQGLGTDPRYNLIEGEETRLLKLTHAHICEDVNRPIEPITMEQLAWRRYAINVKCGGDVLLFHQEYPASPREAFIAAGLPKFNVAVLSTWLDNCRPPAIVGTFPRTQRMTGQYPELILGETQDVKVWKPPVEGHRYVIGADCKGSDPFGDWHFGFVLDKTSRPKEHVASIHGMWDADLYASLLVQAARWYWNALLSIEVNGVGEAVQNPARKMYHNFYHRIPIDKEVRFPGDKIGWYTGPATRPNIIETMAAAIRDETIISWDEEFVEQCISFQAVPGSRVAEHAPGAHDDAVFGGGIALETEGYASIEEMRTYDRSVHESDGGTHMGKFR